MERRAFLTGSHVYGTPNEDSDVDLVIFIEPASMHKLVSLFVKGKDDEHYDDCPTAQFNVAGLNLLLCTREREFDGWKRGTELLKKNAPVTRDEAKAIFKQIRASGREEDVK